MEKVFNKLVRDNIPDIINNKGEQAITRILPEEEYKKELFKKLEEEGKEVINATSKKELIEELADLNEVLNFIMLANGISTSEVETIREQKKIKRGGFEKRIFLEKTIIKEN